MSSRCPAIATSSACSAVKPQTFTTSKLGRAAIVRHSASTVSCSKAVSAASSAAAALGGPSCTRLSSLKDWPRSLLMSSLHSALRLPFVNPASTCTLSIHDGVREGCCVSVGCDTSHSGLACMVEAERMKAWAVD